MPDSEKGPPKTNAVNGASSSTGPDRPPVRVDWHAFNVKLDALLRRRVIQVALIGLFVGVVAVLLGEPFLSAPSSHRRLVVGERAAVNIKATRDFEHTIGAETLQVEQEAAMRAVKAVFDYQADLTTTLLQRVNQAFQVAADHAHEVMSGSDAMLRRAEPQQPRNPASVARAKEEIRIELEKQLQVPVPRAMFERFWKDEFSLDLRASITALIAVAMTEFVLDDREVLRPLASTGIVVRHLIEERPSRRREEEVYNFSRIRDLDDVREIVRQQAHVHGAKLSTELRDSAVALVDSLIVPNLSLSTTETAQRRRQARLGVLAHTVRFVKGQIVVRDGEPITKEHLSIIKSMNEGFAHFAIGQALVGLGLLALLLVVAVYAMAGKQFRRFVTQPRDIFVMGVLVVGSLGITSWALGMADPMRSDLPVWVYALPVAAGAMLVRLLITAEAAAVFAMATAILVGLAVDRYGILSVFFSVTGLIGSMGVGRVQSRTRVIRAGLFAGIGGAGTVLGLQLISGNATTGAVVNSILAAIVGGLASSLLTLSLLPLLEKVFDYVTDLTLLELGNLNHPLIRELMLKAPGTYHHSIVLGSLCETACDAIGANGLLARVACNFHDVGKTKNSPYFGENAKGQENPHNRLKPSMSALIIRSHIKDTIEMLREHGIPEKVISVATQHHGTMLMEYFYHKALEQRVEGEEVHEEDYRYPGPKPQSREAGIIMLADGVEAAARSLTDPNEDRLRAVVQRIINLKFTDDQLAHTDLTLRDLHIIARSFLQVLSGIYHQRPTYPWQQRDGKGDERGEESGRKAVHSKEFRRRKDGTRGDPSLTGVSSPRLDATEARDAAHKDQKEAGDGKKSVQKGKRRDDSLPGIRSRTDPGHRSEGTPRTTGRMAPVDPQGARPSEARTESDEPSEDKATNVADIKRLGLN